ncbi:MAG TPA: hypothetical protein VFR31_14915, partial [Thermoanaerobaculia bacterium]|nr:hypothetical protein [Thermoanaerobaculia bacterium]
YDLEPKRLPNLYHGMPVRLYGRYRDNGPVKIHLKASVNGQPLERTVDLEIAEDAENPEIERMWAWHRVQQLLKDADREGSRAGVIDEIVRLGEGFSIVTEYTSFLVLENDAEYKRWQIERRNALRIERDRRAQTRVREELDRMRGKTLSGLGPVEVEKRASTNPLPAVPPAAMPAPAPEPQRNRGDVDFGGGGALDPFSIGLALLLVLGAWRGALSTR